MQANGSRASPESMAPPGVVELREDVPLKAGSGGDPSHCCGGGPKFILGCFAALTGGITLALLTQIYYGYHELVPHGSVSSSAAECSRAGSDALKAGGRALDAAAAAALCLAVMAPHRTSLDASGSLLHWQYQSAHAQSPLLHEWGGPETTNDDRPPRLVAALASLHAQYGVLPWSRVLQPAVDLAKNGFPVSAGLSAATAATGAAYAPPGSVRTAVLIGSYLEGLQRNTSLELSTAWKSDALVRTASAQGTYAGEWRVFAGGAGAAAATGALAVALQPPLPDADTAFQKVVASLQKTALGGEWPLTGVSSGLAVVDWRDTYVALVSGLSSPFGSGPLSGEGWLRDEPKSALDLAPAIIVQEQVCGTRYILGAESSSALAEGAAALLTSEMGAGAVEGPRVAVYAGGVLAIEASRDPPTALPPAQLVNATTPYSAVNVIQQRGDDLLSHADSRGGGLAFRFK